MKQLTLGDALDTSLARVKLREDQALYGPTPRRQVCEPSEICRLLWDEVYRDEPNEVFVTCCLNTSNVVQKVVLTSEGGLASSIVEPRQVFQAAVLDNAAALILAHNHPSGNAEPSREDIKITRQLADAGDVMGIPVYDHLIITGNDTYTSFAERGVL